jgi:2-amino-4-hydroxy-6-hydroxymethyldihydropteridine diphosphokinase
LPGRSEPAATRAWLGLGGNVGDPETAMAAALGALDARDDCAVVAVSGLYRTPPWGVTDQPDFFNACAAVDTTLSARALLDVCLGTEAEFHRVRTRRWGPRTIDIDILVYGDDEIDEEGLHVPHPRMTERAFVMVPLAEIAANLEVGGRTVGEWAADCDATGMDRLERPADWWRRS